MKSPVCIPRKTCLAMADVKKVSSDPIIQQHAWKKLIMLIVQKYNVRLSEK